MHQTVKHYREMVVEFSPDINFLYTIQFIPQSPRLLLPRFISFYQVYGIIDMRVNLLQCDHLLTPLFDRSYVFLALAQCHY
jgi:hypothetical protein